MDASPLNRLPPELRLQIYERVFSTSEPIRIASEDMTTSHHASQTCKIRGHEATPHTRIDCHTRRYHSRQPRDPNITALSSAGNAFALTQTCSQVRRETNGLVFAHSHFVIDWCRFRYTLAGHYSSDALQLWDNFLVAIGPENAASLTNVAFVAAATAPSFSGLAFASYLCTALRRLFEWSTGNGKLRSTITFDLIFVTGHPSSNHWRDLVLVFDPARLSESIADAKADVDEELKLCKTIDFGRTGLEGVRGQLVRLQQAFPERKVEA
ncbi:hypothetical protein LTR85_010550 [Meristemomyces frigidus]|nr:hypothetical protein LTR85_010550 [Meristemomyces frigidus]